MKVVTKSFLKQVEFDQFVFVLSAVDACTSQTLHYLIKEKYNFENIFRLVTDL